MGAAQKPTAVEIGMLLGVGALNLDKRGIGVGVALAPLVRKMPSLFLRKREIRPIL